AMNCNSRLEQWANRGTRLKASSLGSAAIRVSAYSASMVRACAVCGLPIPDGARYCPNCGAAAGPLVETEERKMVTVLFADLVDSTGLAQHLDAERSREVLGRFFDAASDELIALRGRPEKFIGDAVMAVFGLPHVHEDDALRAVRAGLAIRERRGRLAGRSHLSVGQASRRSWARALASRAPRDAPSWSLSWARLGSASPVWRKSSRRASARPS